MRLACLVAFEVTLLLSVVGGGVWGAATVVARSVSRAGKPAFVAHERSFEATKARQSLPSSNQAARDLSNVPDVVPNPAREGTFDGARDDLILERLRSGRIVSIAFNRGGSSISLRLTFANGFRAACKPDQVNLQSQPRKEIAAYRINRLLGLTGVPPAAARFISLEEIERLIERDSRQFLGRIREEVLFGPDGRVGATVSYWVPKIRDARLEKENIPMWELWLRIDGTIPPGNSDFVRQLSGMLVLDLLTSNYDRFTGTNDLMSPDGKTLYYMDNTIGFYLEPEGHPRPREHFVRAQRFSRHLYERLKALDEAALRAELAKEPSPPWPVLTDEEIAAVLRRKDFALRHIERMIQMYGREAVLSFP